MANNKADITTTDSKDKTTTDEPTKEVSDNKTNTNLTLWTQNYLILMIVFIVLLCALTAVAFVFTSKNLNAFQNWFLLIFLVLIPLVSIPIVTWLILRHSGKLAVSENDGSIKWETTSEIKQKRRLNNEIRELAKHLEIPTEQLSDLRSAYIVAEDLALRKVQSEADIPLMHKISIGNNDFDAVYINEDLITLVEVAFVVTNDVSQDNINLYMRKAAAAKQSLTKMREGSRLRFLLVLVTQLDEKFMPALRSNVRNKFNPKTTPVSVDITFLDFLNLQKIYAED